MFDLSQWIWYGLWWSIAWGPLVALVVIYSTSGDWAFATGMSLCGGFVWAAIVCLFGLVSYDVGVGEYKRSLSLIANADQTISLRKDTLSKLSACKDQSEYLDATEDLQYHMTRIEQAKQTVKSRPRGFFDFAIKDIED